jgi:hypothetical protein
VTLDRDDIEAAVAAGVIPQAQADALQAFIAERRRAPLAESGQEDESFRFMTGFNDFFFAIGILLLGFGVGLFSASGQMPVWVSLIPAALVWGLSELLVRRLRLVLPGILLSVFFIVFVYRAVPIDLLPIMQAEVPRFPLTHPVFHALFGLTGAPAVTIVKSLVGAAAAGLYYWRFRLPFALLPIGVSLVALTLALVEYTFGQLPVLTDALITLGCGLCAFAIAMRYDISDRERVTRRSDCAFWLHLLAAPLIVHSLIAFVGSNFLQFNNTVAVAVLLIVAILAVIAIVIDRRALLVSALLYVGLVIAYAIGGTGLWQGTPRGMDRGLVFFATLTILGAFVITLGVGWAPLRRLMIPLISPSIAARLPPILTRA